MVVMATNLVDIGNVKVAAAGEVAYTNAEPQIRVNGFFAGSDRHFLALFQIGTDVIKKSGKRGSRHTEARFKIFVG